MKINDVVSVLVVATPPAECDELTARLCEHLSLLGLGRATKVDGIFTVDIGPMIETAVSHVFPDAAVEPEKAAERMRYEDYQEEQRTARDVMHDALAAADPGERPCGHPECGAC